MAIENALPGVLNASLPPAITGGRDARPIEPGSGDKPAPKKKPAAAKKKKHKKADDEEDDTVTVEDDEVNVSDD